MEINQDSMYILSVTKNFIGYIITNHHFQLYLCQYDGFPEWEGKGRVMGRRAGTLKTCAYYYKKFNFVYLSIRMFLYFAFVYLAC